MLKCCFIIVTYKLNKISLIIWHFFNFFYFCHHCGLQGCVLCIFHPLCHFAVGTEGSNFLWNCQKHGIAFFCWVYSISSPLVSDLNRVKFSSLRGAKRTAQHFEWCWLSYRHGSVLAYWDTRYMMFDRSHTLLSLAAPNLVMQAKQLSKG